MFGFSQDLQSEIEDISLALLHAYIINKVSLCWDCKATLTEREETMKCLLTYKFPIAALTMLFVLSMSCSHEPAVEPQEPDGTDVARWNDSTINGDAVMSEMAFCINEGMVVERQENTRTTTAFDGTGAFSENDLIAIAVTRSGESEVVKPYRVKNDGSLEYAGSDNVPFAWKSTSETISIRAWSYGSSIDSEDYLLTAPETFDYSLATNQTGGYHELLYLKASEKTYSKTPMTLTFYHQLSRIVFNVDHELDSALAVTSVSIGGAFHTSARFSVPTGESNVGSWDLKSATSSITPHKDATQTGYQHTYSIVVFPQTCAKDSRLFTLTNSDGSYSYDISEDAGRTFAIANQYNYTITVKNAFVQDFSYVASAQPFTAPKTGTYKIECWGASGGGATIGKGCGGYVSGIITLTKDQVLYVYTGQQGIRADNHSSTYMYNGGGYTNLQGTHCGPCGGGATDIRTNPGTGWDTDISKNSRIMIAAGGGGTASDTYDNSCAGGLNGYDGYVSGYKYYAYGGKGATQSTGGAGGSKYSNAQAGTSGYAARGGIGGYSMASSGLSAGGGGGGGGGLYGGGGASGLTNGSFPGGGGSSYISGHPGCTAKELTFSSPVMIDGAGYQWTTSKGSQVGIPSIADASVRTNGYVGNGYCRITRVGY